MVTYSVFADGPWPCQGPGGCAAFSKKVSRKNGISECNKRCKEFSDCTAWKVQADGRNGRLADGWYPKKGTGDSNCHLFKEITWKYYPWVTFRKKNGVWKKAWNTKRRSNNGERWLYGKRQDC